MSHHEDDVMGNTQLPQGGAADEKNGRATRSGLEQLTDDQQQDAHGKSPTEVKPPDPAVSLDEALTGYVDTGHSPPAAT
jgi:hypothetical protein